MQRMPTDAIREIVDPTDDANFAYDIAQEKFYEDEKKGYFFGGLDLDLIADRCALCAQRATPA